mmetsp:Transcript_18296/g.31697  ORF Transcript_18296/g.31697 Transcript_18296/m.31697 type:complete len:115 (-) Transcript_18296:223-567(-)
MGRRNIPRRDCVVLGDVTGDGAKHRFLCSAVMMMRSRLRPLRSHDMGRDAFPEIENERDRERTKESLDSDAVLAALLNEAIGGWAMDLIRILDALAALRAACPDAATVAMVEWV